MAEPAQIKDVRISVRGLGSIGSTKIHSFIQEIIKNPAFKRVQA